jgi:hypothetical protein
MKTTLTTWLPEGFLFDSTLAATFVVMKQYLILIENLVREGKSEDEIEKIVSRLVDEDVEASDEQLDDGLRPAA